jgi:hypothetical protein
MTKPSEVRSLGSALTVDEAVAGMTAFYDEVVDRSFANLAEVMTAHGASTDEIAELEAAWRRDHIAPGRVRLQTKLTSELKASGLATQSAPSSDQKH